MAKKSRSSLMSSFEEEIKAMDRKDKKMVKPEKPKSIELEKSKPVEQVAPKVSKVKALKKKNSEAEKRKSISLKYSTWKQLRAIQFDLSQNEDQDVTFDQIISGLLND